METKLNKLLEAVVGMARMERRLLTIFKPLEHMDAAFKKYDDRVGEIEKQALIRGQNIAFSESLFWMVFTGAVGLAFVFVRHLVGVKHHPILATKKYNYLKRSQRTPVAVDITPIRIIT